VGKEKKKDPGEDPKKKKNLSRLQKKLFRPMKDADQGMSKKTARTGGTRSFNGVVWAPIDYTGVSCGGVIWDRVGLTVGGGKTAGKL